MTVRTTLALARGLLCTTLATGARADLKIGYVDLQRACNESEAGKAGQGALPRFRSTACRWTSRRRRTRSTR